MPADDSEKFKKALIKIAYEEKLNKYKKFSSESIGKVANRWLQYSMYFTEATETLAKELLRKPTDPNSSGTLVVIPTIYLLRHSLELLIKLSYKILDQKITIDHDIYKQFKSLESDLLNFEIDVKATAQKYSVQEITVKEFNKDTINKFSGIVYKYHYQFPLLNSLKKDDFYIEDTGNELFKYPEANNIRFSFSPSIMLGISDEDKQDILEDIEVLKYYWSVLHVFGQFGSRKLF